MKHSFGLLVIVLVVFGFLAQPADAGLLDGLFKVDVPDDIVQTLDLDQNRVTLTEAPHVYDDYAARTTDNLARFERSIRQVDSDYQGLASIVNNATELGLDKAKTAFPGGALLIGLGASVVTWMLPSPRQRKANATNQPSPPSTPSQ